MKDSISVIRLETLHPRVRDVFKNWIDLCEGNLSTPQWDIKIRIQSTPFRSIEEQNEDYCCGRTQDELNKIGLSKYKPQPGPVKTWAIGGHSWHNYGLAADLCVIVNGVLDWNYDYYKLAALMPAGMEWGGNWTGKKKSDLDHFEIRFGLTVWQAIEKFNANQMTNGYIDI